MEKEMSECLIWMTLDGRFGTFDPIPTYSRFSTPSGHSGRKKPLRRVAGRCSFKFYFFVNSKQDATFGLAETWV
jgi:hypothetical protein